MSDEELARMTVKESSLFRYIVERYEEKLARYIARLGIKSMEDQQDVLQEIFIKVYKNLNAFDTTLKFSSWIYRIAHNEAISWYRKRDVRPEGHLIAESDDVLTLVKSSERSQEQLFDEGVNAQLVAEALTKIDIKYRTVLILRYFEHKEYEEISDILQIPTGSVGTLIHRGKKQLAEYIDPTHIRI